MWERLQRRDDDPIANTPVVAADPYTDGAARRAESVRSREARLQEMERILLGELATRAPVALQPAIRKRLDARARGHRG